MAIRGLNPNLSIAYIPECERNSDNPTTFYLKPRGNVRANKYASLYIKAVRDDRNGQTKEIDEKAAIEADVTSFIDMLEKVDNFIFSSQYPDYQFEEDGVTPKLWVGISDKKMLKAIYNEIGNDVYNEVVKASGNTSLFNQEEKKS